MRSRPFFKITLTPPTPSRPIPLPPHSTVHLLIFNPWCPICSFQMFHWSGPAAALKDNRLSRYSLPEASVLGAGLHAHLPVYAGIRSGLGLYKLSSTTASSSAQWPATPGRHFLVASLWPVHFLFLVFHKASWTLEEEWDRYVSFRAMTQSPVLSWVSV